jgi:hypothetical protein
MHKTRKQRGGAAKMPKRMTYSKRRELERKQPIGYERPRTESRINWVKPIRSGREPTAATMMNLVVNTALKQIKKEKKARKLNLTLNIRRNNSTLNYIKSIKTLLYKTNEILREPTEDYDVALEISEELKKELNELEESLNTKKTALSDETSPEEVIERVIELINKFKKPSNNILIAVTVDGAVTRAKAGIAAEASAENAEVGELAAMLGTMRPFGRI